MHEKVDVIVPLRSMSRSASEARVVGAVRFVLHLSPLYSISLAQKIHVNCFRQMFINRGPLNPRGPGLKPIKPCGRSDPDLLSTETTALTFTLRIRNGRCSDGASVPTLLINNDMHLGEVKVNDVLRRDQMDGGRVWLNISEEQKRNSEEAFVKKKIRRALPGTYRLGPAAASRARKQERAAGSTYARRDDLIEGSGSLFSAAGRNVALRRLPTPWRKDSEICHLPVFMEKIHRRIRVTDIAHIISKLKRHWACHIARRTSSRWEKKILGCRWGTEDPTIGQPLTGGLTTWSESRLVSGDPSRMSWISTG
ncbi:hypothetical protein EVAR_8908_1 [Eumeta japonica]|uniref:Uncharacterized protein n=1 Tax=Eumeta variegata TaxID=151549 RepID=A0A4C1U0L4_EUMVA|nr:hypothetical protein EVAR_8908_1 [Eumeta japonica]